MVFFQVLLLAGYAYAHGLTRLPAAIQGRLHAALLAVATLLLAIAWWRNGSPLIPADAWKPRDSGAPQMRLLLVLVSSIGLPYFLLSTTSPLIQHWQGQRDASGKIWRLYAISNTGSLLGLVSYPFLIERYLTLPQQAIAWAGTFAVFALGAALLALRARHCEPVNLPAEPARRPSLFTLSVWLILPMTTSAMLLAVTNELCQEIAAVPFLWMVPLALYLLTFIICFDRPNWYHRRFFLAAGGAATVVVLITASLGLKLKIPVHVVSFGGFLFLFCMIGHGELVRQRPATSQLTLFYLLVALGGALGGVFVSLVAPLVFDNFWEFNVMATVAWALLGILLLREKDSLFHSGDWWQLMLFVWFLSYLGIRVVTEELVAQHIWAGTGLPQHAALALALAYTLCAPIRATRFARSKYWPRVTVVTIIFIAECFMLWRIRMDRFGALISERNFYGTLRVSNIPARTTDTPARIQLTHGNINHGFQYVDDALSRIPVSYYGDSSGINLAVRRHPRRLANPPKPMRIGVLGLGAGTMAAFGEPGDLIRFYEINPAVIRYSTAAKPIFTYLSNSRAATEIVEGDARLSLERELNAGHPGQFDLLVMDAFSSDSVPVHLLTREAFDLYRRSLRDSDSLLAINISNRFLDFRDLVGSHAKELNLLPVLFRTTDQNVTHGPSSWLILSESLGFLKDEEIRRHGFPWIPQREVLWTDSFSNLFQILRW